MSKIKPRTLIFLILTAGFTVIGLVFLFVRLSLTGAMYEQSAASRWSEDGDYTMMSSFWLPENGLDTNRIYLFRQQINSALTAESIPANTDNSGSWYDAYSAVTSVYASTVKKSMSLSAVVTGGSYFYIHSHELISGAYYQDTGMSGDYCILDENAAWQLFGAIDIAGMELTIENHTFAVSGVVKAYQDSVSQFTGTAQPTVYLLYRANIFMQNEPPITCYEAVLPNPISDFADGIFNKSVTSGFKTVNNTARYSLGSLWKTMTGLTDTSSRTADEINPYWENAALKAQNQAAVLLFFELLAFTVAVIFGLFLFIPLVKNFFTAIDILTAKIRHKFDY